MATSEDRRLAVYGALVARFAGHLNTRPATDEDVARYESTMRDAVRSADILAEVAEIAYLSMKGADALVEPAPTRIKRVLEDELVKIAEELSNPMKTIVTRDAEDPKRVNVDFPVRGVAAELRVVTTDCALPLKLLDADELCGRCRQPAKQHRNWEAGQ